METWLKLHTLRYEGQQRYCTVESFCDLKKFRCHLHSSIPHIISMVNESQVSLENAHFALKENRISLSASNVNAWLVVKPTIFFEIISFLKCRTGSHDIVETEIYVSNK